MAGAGIFVYHPGGAWAGLAAVTDVAGAFCITDLPAGTYDLLAEVVCESDEHLLELISEKIRRIHGVSRTETFMYLKLQKQTYSWGVR